MRNDARPIGHGAPDSPIGTPQSEDARDSVKHDRQSPIVNRRAEEDARRDDADLDPVMPTGDATLNTKI